MITPAGDLSADVWRKLATGAQLLLPNLGLETLHHVHADDVAQAFARAVQRRGAGVGESFHVVSERALTLRGYATAAAGWFGREPVLRLVGWNDYRRQVPTADADITWDHIAHSPSVSIEKARRLLGYAPRFSSLDTAAAAVRWMAQHGGVDLAGADLAGVFMDGVGFAAAQPPG